MVFIFPKKKINGKKYYYLAHNEWKNGKSGRAWEVYLGTEDMVKEFPKKSKPKGFQDFEFGLSASLYDTSEKLGLMEIIDKNTGKRNQGIPVSKYLLLMSISRSHKPISKNQIADWYKKTTLARLLKLNTKSLKSQNFWDNMCHINGSEIKNIEKDICKSLIDRFDVNMENLLYDPTNFATFIAEHEGNKLPQRGNNKKKRFDLKQIAVALLVTLDFSLPLMHETYEGNKHDSKQFPIAIDSLTERFGLFSKKVKRLTIAFDKGNNSEENIKKLDGTKYCFVGSLKPSDYKKFLEIPLDNFEPIYEKNSGEEILACRFKHKVFGIERTVAVSYEDNLCKRNSWIYMNNVKKRVMEIEKLKAKIGSPKYKTIENVEKGLGKILNKKGSKNILGASLTQDKEGIHIEYWMNWEKFAEKEKGFGKNIYFTNNHDWSTEQIIRAYRNLGKIEDCFNEMNNPYVVSVDPKYHWKDQKIKAHVFACVIGLLLVNLTRRRICLEGVEISVEKMVEELKGIKEIAYKMKGSRGASRGLTEMNKIQKKMFKILGLKKYE